jgi:dTDP-4-dehydrorhamnose reductase
MINVLITGCTGMLGATLSKSLLKHFKVYSTGRSKFINDKYNCRSFDLNEQNYDELILWSNPEIIIHCAAITNGKYCSENPAIANKINGLSIKKLIDATSTSTKIIYISSDAVFSSSTIYPSEKNKTNPESVYGKSKDLGEYYLKKFSKNFNIVRTTIVGLNVFKKNESFVEWIINSNLKKQKINLFNDVKFNPISIWDFSKEIKFIIDNNINEKILHISGSEICSKYEFGIQIIRSLNLNLDYVSEGAIENNNKRFKRSLDQSINCKFYQKKYNRLLPTVKQTVNQIKLNYI